MYWDEFDHFDAWSDHHPEDEDEIYENVVIIHHTEKAYLLKLDDGTEFWAPKVAISFYDATTISVASWFEIKGVREL